MYIVNYSEKINKKNVYIVMIADNYSFSKGSKMIFFKEMEN